MARTYPNAYFVPAGIVSYEDLVYDEAGALVETSATWRRMSGGWISNPPPSLPTVLRHQGDVRTVSGDHLFLGRFNEVHYGHWLTEGVARLWVLLPSTDEMPGDRRQVITSARVTSLKERVRPWLKPRSCHWRAGLRAFRLQADRFTVTSRPARVASITVPEPSMRIEESLHPAHLRVCREIGGHIVARRGCPAVSRQAVYLSRAGLTRHGLRSYAGEEELEVELQRLGVHVVRPESLSLRHQVALFTTHTTFIGTWGSAFHSLLLRQDNDAATCVYLVDQRTTDSQLGERTNFLLIDQLMGNHVHWIRTLSEGTRGDRLRAMDVEATLKAIRPLVTCQKS